MEQALMLELASHFEAMVETIRRHYASSSTPSPAARTWTSEDAVALARRVKADLGSAQAFAIGKLACAYPSGLPASALAVNPKSMPNTYDLLDQKLAPLDLVRCEDGYPRKYFLGPVFERTSDKRDA